MNGHAAADKDEPNCGMHHSLREQMGQLVDRERVLCCENDQLRAQLVEMKQQEKKKYDDLMVQYNMKLEYEDDGLDKQGTSNNQVTLKTEWDHEEVKVQIKEEIKEEEDDAQDHNIIIKREYVSAYIKTESDDVKVEIKEEIKEAEDGHDYCGFDLRLVKKEEVSDDDEVDNEGGLIRGGDNDEVDDERYEVTLPNVDCGQLLSNPSRDSQNASNANESIEVCVANLSSRDQHNTTTLNEPNEVTTVTQSAQTFSPQTSTGHGSIRTSHRLLDQQTTASTGRNGNKRKQPTSKRSVKRSKNTIEVDDGEDIANEDRARQLDRTDTVQEVSTAVAVDLREGDEQNGGGGEGLRQIEEDDDETELNEEDEGGHYKIEIVKLKCTEDGCEEEVEDREELNDHLRGKHHISPYRCLAEGCNERFEHWGELGAHVRDNHSNISTWSCPHCTKTFKSHSRLYMHLYLYHFEGQYKCGYDACHFDRVATLRIEIQSHQKSVHSKPTIFTCQFPNCGKSFNTKFNLECHQRIHQAVKPFKCTWNRCDYAATQQGHAIRHIRMKHFHLPATEKKQRELGIQDNRNPRDYLQHEHDNSPV